VGFDPPDLLAICLTQRKGEIFDPFSGFEQEGLSTFGLNAEISFQLIACLSFSDLAGIAVPIFWI